MYFTDTDRARKHGMEEFIAADPVTADHHSLFSDLQKWSLDWRLKDPFASLVRKKNFWMKFDGSKNKPRPEYNNITINLKLKHF